MQSRNFKFLKPGEIRTRYAPAPTGFLHIGSARTALFNYLFAKKHQGSFILRIEDTDVKRSKLIFEKDILETLKWLGIEWDEGPILNTRNQKYIGNYGPYRQSERLEIYVKYLKKLLNEGKAYYCFCTPEELEAQKQEQLSRGEPPKYSGKCSRILPQEIKKNLAEGKNYIIRFRNYSKKITVNDLIRGKIDFDASLIGDFAIAKTIDRPLYNFSAAIDDSEMKISHVIRGEDLLPNTPKQILIQEALKLSSPLWAHLPLILGPDRSKLSKRHGATAVSEYRKEGYLPEAIINFIAFLGWNPGTEREIYSLPSLIKDFSLEKIQKGGAILNIKRLDFLNGFYIRQRSLEKLTELCLPYLIKAGFIEKIDNQHSSKGSKLFKKQERKYKIKSTLEIVNLNWLGKIIALYQDRLKKLSDIIELTDFFFKDKLEYNRELLKWRQMEDREIILSLNKLEMIISDIKKENWERESLQKVLLAEAEKEKDRGILLWPLRVALTGKEASAGPFEVAEILGKEKTLKRIREAKNLIK